nr:hypothetical protein [Streptomyces sp. alain-838]
MTRRTVITAAGAGALASGLPTTASALPGTAGTDVLAVVEKSGHAVGFYDAGSGRRMRTVPLPDHPHEMVVDSRKRFAYVGHYGVRMSSTVGEGGAAVFVIDLADEAWPAPSTPGRSTASTAWASTSGTGSTR